jgi:biotin carboxyl carrier protein
MDELTSMADARAAAVDPRAVRVSLDAEAHPDDAHSVRVSPAMDPLRMTNPTVGRGPLGGAAMAPTDDPTDGVSTQRQMLVDDAPSVATVRNQGGGRYLLAEDAGATRVILEAASVVAGGIRRREVLVDGFRFVVDVESEWIAALRERASRGRASSAHGGPLQVKAIIPGKVVAVSIKAGDAVMAGQQLLVVEAMKMQNELRAPRDGTIERVGVAVGVNIEIGDLLVVIS